jgi:predicted DNA-binding transcriptional regulator YafY
MSFTPETLLRQWQTLRMIPRSPAKVTATELCANLKNDGFTVGKRTIERDLQSLSTIFPIVSDERSKPYGWSWRKDVAAFDLPGLSNSEAVTLLLAREHLRNLLPASAVGQLQPYFALAEQKLSALEPTSGMAGWQQKVRVISATQPLLAPKIDEAVQVNLHEALLHNKQCQITYLKREAVESESYPVHPLGLVQRGQVIYLVCTIKTYAQIRLLALHRMLNVELLDTSIAPPADFNLDDYIASGALGWLPKSNIHLTAIFSAEVVVHLYETPLSEDQTLLQLSDGRIQLTARVKETQQLRWWLQGFGDAVEVVHPVSLRREIAGSAQRVAQQYAKSDKQYRNGKPE